MSDLERRAWWARQRREWPRLARACLEHMAKVDGRHRLCDEDSEVVQALQYECQEFSYVFGDLLIQAERVVFAHPYDFVLQARMAMLRAELANIIRLDALPHPHQVGRDDPIMDFRGLMRARAM
jgi:hypothetical protein